MSKKDDTAKKFAVGTAIAAGIGYLAGVLTAPKSGKETRGDIKDAAAKGIAEAEKQLKKVHDDLDGLLDEAKDKSADMSSKTRKEFDDLVDTAKDSKEKVHDLIGKLGKGAAEDKDLKKAINDATKAIEHLRDYLSK